MSQEISNVDFSIKNNIIYINYDLLDCPSKSLYDIRLKFIDKQGGEIYPTYISGDIKKVDCGNGKRIEWDVLQDKSELKDEVQAIIEISKKYSTKVTGGPSNAFLSMLLPGLGSVNVTYGESLAPLAVTGAFLGSLYFAYRTKAASDHHYKLYHEATTQPDMDINYEWANSYFQYAQFWVGLAGAIWLGDVFYVTAKGFKNRKEQLSFYSKHRKNINLYIVGTANDFRVGLVKKF